MNRVRALREAAGLSQAQLAELSGVAQPNIAAYEADRRPLTAGMFERLTRATTRPSELVAQQREEIRRLVHHHRASNPRVFGSVALGTDRPASDLDLLVTMDEDASLFDLAELHLELEALLGIRVDVLDDGGLKPKHRVILDQLVAL